WRRRTDFGKERTVESFTERLSAEMAGKSPCRVNVRVGQPTPLPLPALADSPGLPYGRWYKTGTGPVVARESRATARACREGRRLAQAKEGAFPLARLQPLTWTSLPFLHSF